MATTKVKIKAYENHRSVIPIVTPNLDEVRKFAAKLHVQGTSWKGEVFGWQSEYHPEPPPDSKMLFTPADFCIGESGIWFFSLLWEHGKDAEPEEFFDDRNILAETVGGGRNR